jgi:mono/diheme cytochrome c family protein
MHASNTGSFFFRFFAVVSLIASTGCELRQAMYDQEKYEPLERSTFFADGLSYREQIPETVARGQLRLDTHYYEGKIGGELSDELPMPVTQELLTRGQERYGIYCTPCHDPTGQGNGIIVKRGLKQPPSLHQQRLRDMPVAYFFDVITNGYGVMYSYASRVPVADRWAIAAYIRTLQLSQNIEFDQLPEEDQRQLQ